MMKVVVADDHEVVRLGISFILHEMFQQVFITEVNNFHTLETSIVSEDIQLLLLDINIPGGNHISMMQSIRIKNPVVPVLVLSGYEEDRYAVSFLHAGANGYLQKEAGAFELKKAIQKVLDGEVYASDCVQKQLSQPPSGPTLPSLVDRLSEREKEVMELLFKGLSSSDIGILLNIHITTVSTLKNRIFQKMKVRNLVQLIEKIKPPLSKG